MYPTSVSGLVALPFLTLALAANVITDDTHFYGQSEPVYPTPEQAEIGAWADAITKAKGLVAQLTLEEKVNLTAGGQSTTGCSGFIPSIPRVNFPGLCLNDAGNGVRNTDYVSSFPSGIHVGASWNEELTYSRSYYMGNEAKTKGVNILLGPVFGPLGRVVEGGRNWEGFSNDPYLAGQLGREAVVGIQDAGIIACGKHWLAQEQETHRLNAAITEAQPVSSNVDDKTLHELYMWPFADAVHAGLGSIMCSYNRANNSQACQNSKLLNGLLKGELGFQGFVVSDWGAQHSGMASALAGMDMAMPTNKLWGGNLTAGVNNGTIPEAQLDNMITRILAPWFQFNQDDSSFPSPGHGIAANLLIPHPIVDARNASSKSTLWDGAVEGHVLVKNTNKTLPFKPNMKMISLFGYSHKAPDKNTPEAKVEGAMFAPWSVGAQTANMTELNTGFMGNLSLTYSAIAPNGTLFTAGGSGASAASSMSAPFDALLYRARKEGTAMFWDFESWDPAVNPNTEACIVAGNAWASEGWDRPGLTDDYTDSLINNVADKCANTIVVLHNAGTRLVDGFISHPNITAVIFAHLPGQDSGEALVSLLYGDENPSGRLPYTVARNETDYGVTLKADLTMAPHEYQHFPQSDFTEGVFTDYRHFDAKNITPRYEFGFGLSYTTFDYADLKISKSDAKSEEYPTGTLTEGGRTDLWDVVATVTVKVSNTGDVDGKEVAQLYVGVPGKENPSKQLRGFKKPSIKAGEATTVTFELTRRDLSVWDVIAQEWQLQQGDYAVYVGRSSRDLPLEETLSLGQ
ncbi:glycoside hydrolase superfamily [Fusarium flagelliforme]|uniref:glycoside hydrolase superfamily n=1 Tax=Fusarium flagelliforme TaxID=2675880 RepID=UPI001E8EAF76|nr:glycoside hydrolase superfamily [Fusarium flagelliforme]KAH7191783.1 glycoside hydrolase superfamily [Fusarium flagelliforme]